MSKTADLKYWVTGLKDCGDCPRCNDRKQVIPGVGNRRNPTLFFITGPVREHEDKSDYGSKFSRPGHDLLKNTLAQYGLNRWEDTYVSSTVKCWAKHPVSLYEGSDCAAYLEVELQDIKPKIIILMGQEAVTWWFETTAPMTLDRVRGRVMDQGFQKIFSTFNPDDIFEGTTAKPELLAEWVKDWSLIATHLPQK